MDSHAIFTSKIEELKEFIKNNGLPDSSNHKKKKLINDFIVLLMIMRN